MCFIFTFRVVRKVDTFVGIIGGSVFCLPEKTKGSLFEDGIVIFNQNGRKIKTHLPSKDTHGNVYLT